MIPKTALVVDDSKSARFALRKYLESHNFKVDTVDGAMEAFAFLRQTQPQVIFLDHVMPGIDGFEALRQIKADAVTASIPVVICSSNDGEAFHQEARERGAIEVLQKPPRPERLALILQQLQDLPAAHEMLGAGLDIALEEFDLALEPALPSTPPPRPAAPLMSTPPVMSSKVSNIREPEVAIEQAVMQALRGAMQSRIEAPPAAAPVRPAPPPASTPIEFNPIATGSFQTSQTRPSDSGLATLREQMDARMRKVTQDLFMQFAELKGAFAHLETRDAGISRAEAQDITDHAISNLKMRLESLESAVQIHMAELSSQIDARLAEHTLSMNQIIQTARAAAAEEAAAVAERTMMAAARRIADQLVDSILKSKAVGHG